MQPIMKAVEEEYKGQVKVVFHDVWTPQGKEDAMKYNIRVIPTQVFLDKDGNEYFRHEGYFPKEGVVDILKTGAGAAKRLAVRAGTDGGSGERGAANHE